MNKELTKEQYKLVKEKAYRLAAELSEKELNKEEFDQIVEREKYSINNEDAKMIFEYTVKYPNDADLYFKIKNEDRKKITDYKNTHNLTYIQDELNWPFDAALTKRIEVGKYDLLGLLESNPELMKFADQAPYYEIIYDEKDTINTKK